MSMISFAWAPRSVESKIKKLPKADRRKARAALNHLLSCRDSDYCAFYDKHLDFLNRHGKDAEEKLRKRPLRYIEQEGCLHEIWLSQIFLYCQPPKSQSNPSFPDATGENKV